MRLIAHYAKNIVSGGHRIGKQLQTLKREHRKNRPTTCYRKSRAIRNAAAAASPPIPIVWRPPRHNGMPVNRALIQPKTSKAAPVTAVEARNAVSRVEAKK